MCYTTAMRIMIMILSVLVVGGCAASSGTPPPGTPPPNAGPPNPGVDNPDDQRPQLTAAACEADGGTVVGDIGDGAIHRPDYRCPDSGEAPIAAVVAEPDGPVAVEGAVCCK